MNVTLRQLRVFLAVARAHSFSRAGDTIGLTQPAVSRSISELEGELGLKLLDRTTREVVLTEVGRSLATALERSSPTWTTRCTRRARWASSGAAAWWWRRARRCRRG